jgi:hypothetical protein
MTVDVMDETLNLLLSEWILEQLRFMQVIKKFNAFGVPRFNEDNNIRAIRF